MLAGHGAVFLEMYHEPDVFADFSSKVCGGRCGVEDDDDDDKRVCRGGGMYVAGILFLSGLWSGGVFYLPCAMNVK